MKTWVIILIAVLVLGIAAFLLLKPKKQDSKKTENKNETTEKPDEKTNIFSVISGISAVLAGSNINLGKK
jgi:preprotein translocase subunit YajC